MTGSAAIKAQVRREMENDKKAREKTEYNVYTPPTVSYIKSTKLQEVTGVFYTCPIAGPALLPKVGDMLCLYYNWELFY